MKLRISCYIFSLALILPVPWAMADMPPIIDTHVHLNQQSPTGFRGASPTLQFNSAVEAALERMDRFGIRRILLMPPPLAPNSSVTYDLEALRFAPGKYPDRISLLGGGGSLNAMIHGTPAEAVTDNIKQRFRAQAEQIIAYGGVGFGEIAAHHLSLRLMGPQHPYEWTPLDHPLFLLLADIAAEKGVPIDLHLDLVPEDMERPDRPIFNTATPSHLKANLPGFERLLSHNPNAKITWAHAGTDPLGTRRPQMQHQLLGRHSNLYMSLRLSQNGAAPFLALDESRILKPGWLALLRDFPERFMLGSDFFHSASGSTQRGPTEESLDNFRVLLRQLPPELADAIAHGNAERLYRLSR